MTARKWVVVISAVVCILVIAASAANRLKNGNHQLQQLYGSYTSEKNLYMNPLSSQMASDWSGDYYTFTENLLIITNKNSGNQQQIAVNFEQKEVDEQEFRSHFMLDIRGVPDISAFRQRTEYTLTDHTGSALYRIYLLDDEMWLARVHKDNANISWSEYFWSVYRMAPYEGEMRARASIVGTSDGVDDFLALHDDFRHRYASNTCYNITPDYIRDNSDYRIFKYNASSASFLLYEGEIYPLAEWGGGYGVTSMALADMDGDESPELYFTYSLGSGLHWSLVAYFNPVTEQVTPLEYVRMMGDLLIAHNLEGGLSLFEATISSQDGFANLEARGGEHVSDVVYVNGQIRLNQTSDGHP